MHSRFEGAKKALSDWLIISHCRNHELLTASALCNMASARAVVPALIILPLKLPSGSELGFIFHSLAKRFGEIILPVSKNFWHLTLGGRLMLQRSWDLEPL